METLAIHTESANLSEEQFFRLCADNKELRIERDKNKNIIIMSPTGTNTGRYNAEILGELIIWNKKNNTGFCFDSSTGFILPDGSMRSPDVSWISKARWEQVPASDKERFAHICPDFIIELRSKSDTLKQQKEKMQEWMANGVKLAWLIDLENKTTIIYKQHTETVEQLFTETLLGETILLGFELKLNEIIN